MAGRWKPSSDKSDMLPDLDIPAVAYVRMSTDHQKYSTENQLDVIRHYERVHGPDLVRRMHTDAAIGDLAAHEKIAPTYMTRVLRLTLLAPNIVEAIVDSTHGPEMTLARVLEPFPGEWGAQLCLGSHRFSIRQTIV